MAESEDTILDNALGIKRASGDTGSAEQHSIPDQITADKYQRGIKSVKTNPMRGIAIAKIGCPPASDVDICDR
jgi:hypothetical protein